MKKILALFLAVLMLFMLASCSHDASDNNGTTNSTKGEPNGDSGNNGNEKNDITFTGQVVVDNAECVIKITEIDPDDMWGYALKVKLENKSSSKAYMFTVEHASINNVECDPFFASEVAAGKKSNDSIAFSIEDLKENGVGEVSDIELTFRVYDSEDLSADDVVNETVHIYPYGEDNAKAFVRTPQATDNVIVDNQYITVIVTGYEMDEIWGYTVNLFILNKSNKKIFVTTENVSVNGYMADPFYGESVSAGKCDFSSMSWFESTFEENEITEVEEIEFLIRVYDSDDWDSDDFANQTVTLNP